MLIPVYGTPHFTIDTISCESSENTLLLAAEVVVAEEVEAGSRLKKSPRDLREGSGVPLRPAVIVDLPWSR